MRVIHLARKPLAESSVALNVLEHGTGALNIDTSRVAGPAWPVRHPSGGGGRRGGIKGDPTPHPGGEPVAAGRWPANAIFEHLPGCRQTGVVQVPGTGLRGATTVTRDTDVRWKPHLNPKSKVETGRVQPVWGYSNPDGTETVAAWECEPGCPVKNLDAQSGDRPVSGAAKTGRPARGGAGTGVVQFGVEEGNGTLHNDSGGASRFFKQIGGIQP